MPKRTVMSLLEKLENLINHLLIKLGEAMWKAVPAPIKNFFSKIEGWKLLVIAWLKTLPSKIKSLISNSAKTAKTLNWKDALSETYKKAMSQYKEKSNGSVGQFKTLVMTPFLMLGQWLNGLTAAQSALLLMFTAGSVLSVIGIVSSGQRMATSLSESGREPASVEEEAKYERPEYYKKQTKHFELVNLRLPVYVAQVNEIKSVDIDFVATMTNRSSKQFLEKNEFQFRDHLILQMEPSVASFPLEEEGKEIIRKKLIAELNDFLKLHEIEGEVEELKIIYVLAN